MIPLLLQKFIVWKCIVYFVRVYFSFSSMKFPKAFVKSLDFIFERWKYIIFVHLIFSCCYLHYISYLKHIRYISKKSWQCYSQKPMNSIQSNSSLFSGILREIITQIFKLMMVDFSLSLQDGRKIFK